MDQPRILPQQADRYGGVPLGVESAWPTAYGTPTAVPGLPSSSSSSLRGSGVGAATSLALAALLGAAPAADAAPYAPVEYDFSGVSTLEATALGVVEVVFEPALHAEELVIRLDDGRSVRFVLERDQHFRPGERVRVVGGRVLPT